MVEQDPLAVRALRDGCAALEANEIQVLHADAFDWLDAGGEEFDIVFLDPPFGRFQADDLCLRLERSGRLKPEALIYLETGADDPVPLLPRGWRLLKSQRAGQVRYYLASRKAAGADAAEESKTKR